MRAIFAADEAEARGDALGTLDIIETFAAGPDGEFFWRPWRAKHLMQITILGPILPGWVISRWICNQALSSLHEGNRWRALRAYDVAVDLRGGEQNLPGRDAADAHGRVVDRDWVYRQQLLYELGGLDFFLRRVASPALVARADSIAEWARARMGGYQLVGSTADTVTWLDLASGDERSVPNVGSGCLVVPGEHVIGRLAPIEGGQLFETRPLLVSAELARRVSEGPDDWLRLLHHESASDEQLSSRHGSYPTLLTDVPTVVWEMAILRDTESPADVDQWPPHVARTVLDVAAGELANPTCRQSEGDLDAWSCLGAALLEPYVMMAVAAVAEPADIPTLAGLGRLLAEPAASFCRDTARAIAEAA